MRPHKVQNNCAFELFFLNLFSAYKLLGRYKRELSLEKNKALIFIKVYSFSKLYLQQKILVASLMNDSLSLDRILVNLRKTYLLTTRIPCSGKLLRQLDTDTTFFHWPMNVSLHTLYICFLPH